MGDNKCSVCQISADLKCSGCKSVFYCGAEHQKQHWKQHKPDCVSYEIASSEILGRFLCAKRDIPANGLILTECPLVLGALSNAAVSEQAAVGPCVGCFELIRICDATARCAGCGCFACRPDCAGLSNPQLHGFECELFKAFGIGPDIYLHIYKNDGLLLFKSFLLQISQKRKWQQLMDMESHEEARKATPNYEESEEIVNFIQTRFVNNIKIFQEKTGKKLISYADKTVLHKICGIIEVNAMTVNLSNGTDLMALYSTARFLAHSCMPNCLYTFDNNNGFKICLQAARVIKKGETLTTMYTHMLWGTAARREHLLATKYFACECQRCADPTELGTYFSGLQCLGPEDGSACDGVLLPVNPLSDKTEWACTKCQIPISETSEINAMIDNIGVELEKVRDPKAITVKILEEMYEKLSCILHPNHFHMFNLKHSLIQTYGYQADYTHLKMSDSQLDRKIKMSQELIDVLRVLDPCSIRLALYTSITMHEQCLAMIEREQRQLKQGKTSKEAALDKFQEIMGSLRKSKVMIRNELDLPQGLACDRSIGKTIEQLEKIAES